MPIIFDEVIGSVVEEAPAQAAEAPQAAERTQRDVVPEQLVRVLRRVERRRARLRAD